MTTARIRYRHINYFAAWAALARGFEQPVPARAPGETHRGAATRLKGLAQRQPAATGIVWADQVENFLFN